MGEVPGQEDGLHAKDTSASFISKEPPLLLQLLLWKKDKGNQTLQAGGIGAADWGSKQNRRNIDFRPKSAHPGSYHVLALNSLDLHLLICKMGILASSSQGCENQVRYGCTCGTSWAPSKQSSCSSGDLVYLNLCSRQQMIIKQKESMISTLSGGEETTRGDRLDLISVLDPSLTVTLGKSLYL